MPAFEGFDAIALLTDGGMLTTERESSKRLHSGFERNLPGCARTPKVTGTNRQRRGRARWQPRVQPARPQRLCKNASPPQHTPLSVSIISAIPPPFGRGSGFAEVTPDRPAGKSVVCIGHAPGAARRLMAAGAAKRHAPTTTSALRPVSCPAVVVRRCALTASSFTTYRRRVRNVRLGVRWVWSSLRLTLELSRAAKRRRLE
jgi:hypothetical protein